MHTNISLLPTMISALLLISCGQKHQITSRKKKNITGLFTVSNAISDKLAHSLCCEGIREALQINNDSSYILKLTCADYPYKLLSFESGKWELVDSVTLKLISVNSKRWIIKIEDTTNRLVIIEKNNKTLVPIYELFRDTTYKD